MARRKTIPFGAKVWYLPASTTPEKQGIQKFQAPSFEGIFLGYDIQTNGRWRGQYRVIPLKALAGSDLSSGANDGRLLKRISIARTLEPPTRGPYTFPTQGLL